MRNWYLVSLVFHWGGNAARTDVTAIAVFSGEVDNVLAPKEAGADRNADIFFGG